MLQPQIVEKPPLTVAGLETTFIHVLSPAATNVEVIGPLWGRLLPRATEIPRRIGEGMYGVIYSRPKDQRGQPDELVYLAGVAVNGVGDLPAGMTSRTVPADTFAVFIHRGPIQGIRDTVLEIYRTWLPQSDYEHAHIADVELYDHRFCLDSPDSEMEYWISVRPKKHRP